MRCRGSVSLWRNPKLSSLGDFGSVEALDRLYLDGTALTNLDALSSLRRLQVLGITANPELTDGRGLARLESSEWLEFADNPKLQALPDFAQMVHAGLISVNRNAALLAFPAFPRLEQLAGGWPGISSVEDNASLTDIAGLDQLRSVESLSIRRNPSLERIVLPALGNVADELVITSNPALDESSIANLAGVASARTKLASNGADSSVAAPCPWAGDGECDSAASEPLCAPGTDDGDCESSPSQ